MKLYIFLFISIFVIISIHASDDKKIELIQLDEENNNNTNNENIPLMFQKKKTITIKEEIFEPTDINNDLGKLHDQGTEDKTNTATCGCASLITLSSLINSIWSLADNTFSTGYTSAITLGLNIINIGISFKTENDRLARNERIFNSIYDYVKNFSGQKRLTNKQIEELYTNIKTTIKQEYRYPSKKEIFLKVLPFINFSISSYFAMRTFFTNDCIGFNLLLDHNCFFALANGLFSSTSTLFSFCCLMEDLCNRKTNMKKLKKQLRHILDPYKTEV